MNPGGYNFTSKQNSILGTFPGGVQVCYLGFQVPKSETKTPRNAEKALGIFLQKRKIIFNCLPGAVSSRYLGSQLLHGEVKRLLEMPERSLRQILEDAGSTTKEKSPLVPALEQSGAATRDIKCQTQR